MKISNTMSMAALCAAVFGYHQSALSAERELVIPNFDGDSPACTVILPPDQSQCTAEGCMIPLSVGERVRTIELSLSCGPTSAPTGFENPAGYVEVHDIQAKNTNGEISLIDDINTPKNKRIRDLHFCLFGKSNNLCGNATILRS